VGAHTWSMGASIFHTF